MKALRAGRRFATSKGGILTGFLLVLLGVYLWATLSDIPRHRPYSREEMDAMVFTVGMDRDFPETMTRILRGPDLEVTIQTPLQATGYYELFLEGNVVGTSGTVIFVLPAKASVFSAPGVTDRFQISKEEYATVVRVPFVVERPGPVALTVPFDWDLRDVAGRIRRGEYEFAVSGRTFHYLFDASGQYFGPIVYGLSEAKPGPLNMSIVVQLADSTYEFSEHYPSSTTYGPRSLTWDIKSVTPSFRVGGAFRDDRARFVFDRVSDLVLLGLGIAIGLLAETLWSARRRADGSARQG